MPEAYRLKFIQLNKDPAETYTPFATRLNWPFQRFLLGHRAQNDPDKIKDLCTMEQFLSKINDNALKNWLMDKQAQSLVELAKLADQFVAIHRNYSNNRQI